MPEFLEAEQCLGKRPHWLPSPEEIAAECERIRAGWTAEQLRRSRTHSGHVPWSLPTINTRMVHGTTVGAI